MKIGIFTGSTYGNTRAAADTLEKLFKDSGVLVSNHDIALVKADKLLEYDLLLIGCSTWYVGEMQDDWYGKLEALSKLDLTGKKVALFGMGDQLTYSDTFQDALGMLAETLEQGGATLVGLTSTDGYKFSNSRAVRGQQFVGLALDDDNQSKLTKPRLQVWMAQLVKELELRIAVGA